MKNMKKCIAKILFTVLCLGSLSAHAGLAQTLGNGTRTVLQKIGENPGWVAYIGLSLCLIYGNVKAYRAHCEQKDEYESLYYEGSDYQEELEDAFKKACLAPLFVGVLALVGIGFSKAALWASKKV